MGRIRILFVYSAQSYGGLTRNLSLIASTLDTQRFEACFLALRSAEDAPNLIELPKKPQLKEESIADRGKLDYRAVCALAERVETGEFDVLSVHGHKADFYAFLLRMIFRKRIPVLSIAHGWVVPGLKMRCYDLLDKFCMRFFDRVVLVRDGQESELPLFPERKIRVIRNGIAKREAPDAVARQHARSELSLAVDTFVLAFCGRLSPEKGVDTAVRALKYLPESVVLLVCGDGPQKQSLNELADKEGLLSRVRFLGFRRDVFSVLHAADVYISCSRKEGLPNNVLEAQSIALPVVASNIAPHRALLRDGSEGLLVEVDDAHSFAAAIDRLRRDLALARRLGRAGQALARSKFSLEKRVALLEREYEVLANEVTGSKL